METPSTDTLLDAFWREFEGGNSLRHTDLLLYHYLVKVCRDKGWESTFELSTTRIAKELGLWGVAIRRSRKRLEKTGLLEVIPGERNSATPQYRLKQPETENKTPLLPSVPKSVPKNFNQKGHSKGVTNEAILFDYLLEKASDNVLEISGQEFPRGSVVTSLSQLSAETRLTQWQVRMCLQKLIATSKITSKTTNKATSITICDYDSYAEERARKTEKPQAKPQADPSKPQADPQADLSLTLSKSAISIRTPKTTHLEIKEKKEKERKQEKETPPPAPPLKKKKKINKKEKKEKPLPTAAAAAQPHVKEDFFEDFLNFYNNTLEQAKAAMVRIRSLTDKRKAALAARVDEHGPEAVREMIRKAAESNFLNGGGERGFVADFDWLFRPDNFLRTLEGCYDNHSITFNPRQEPYGTTPKYYTQQEFEQYIAAQLAQPYSDPDDISDIDDKF